MKAKVQKWGNSLGVRIPKEIVIQAELAEGSEVEMDSDGTTVTLRPLKKRKLTLKSLVASLKASKNKYEETSWGPDVGKEVWDWDEEK